MPKCPICGSSNINKITIGTRSVKTAVFEVVDDAGKTYKCENCGSKFSLKNITSFNK